MERKVVFLLFMEFISAFSTVKCRVRYSREGSSVKGESRGRPLLRQPRASNFLPINTRLLIIFLPRKKIQIGRNFIPIDSRLLIELPFLSPSLLLTEISGMGSWSAWGKLFWSPKCSKWQKSPTSWQGKTAAAAASEAECATRHGYLCAGITERYFSLQAASALTASAAQFSHSSGGSGFRVTHCSVHSSNSKTNC